MALLELVKHSGRGTIGGRGAGQCGGGAIDARSEGNFELRNGGLLSS